MKTPRRAKSGLPWTTKLDLERECQTCGRPLEGAIGADGEPWAPCPNGHKPRQLTPLERELFGLTALRKPRRLRSSKSRGAVCRKDSAQAKRGDP